jgi:two-component system cell cycle sensor histidine kinase/response regulator CckA
MLLLMDQVINQVSDLHAGLAVSLPGGDRRGATPSWLLTAALGQVRESVIITDTDLDEPGPRIVYVNPAFTKMTGYEPEEVIGRSPRFLQGPKTTRKTLDRLRAQLEKGERFEGEDINYKKGGAEFFIDWYIEPLRDAAGDIVYFLAVQRDVTERRALEEQIQRAQRLDGIGMLASGIAHDLNNVLSPILMGSDFLRDKMPDEATGQIIDLMESAAQRGSNLVKQILSFARGIAGERGLVQPRHVLDEVVKMAKQTFPKGITIRSNVRPECWMVTTDATQLHQIVLNLMVNARDALEEKGTIAIETENAEFTAPIKTLRGEVNPGQYVIVKVTDSGTGIPPQIIERIFDPFFTTKEEGKGTGLGLSTVFTILKNNGGGIDLETAPGKGAKFSVYLPAETGTAESRTPWDKRHAAMGGGRKILIIDDEAAIAGILRETLQMAGHKVESFLTGAEGLARAEEEPFHCAVVDVMMPGISGEALIRKLRKCQPKLAVIAITGLSEEDAVKKAPGADRILTKPCSVEEILTAVEQITPQPDPQ